MVVYLADFFISFADVFCYFKDFSIYPFNIICIMLGGKLTKARKVTVSR